MMPSAIIPPIDIQTSRLWRWISGRGNDPFLGHILPLLDHQSFYVLFRCVSPRFAELLFGSYAARLTRVIGDMTRSIHLMTKSPTERAIFGRQVNLAVLIDHVAQSDTATSESPPITTTLSHADMFTLNMAPFRGRLLSGWYARTQQPPISFTIHPTFHAKVCTDNTRYLCHMFDTHTHIPKRHFHQSILPQTLDPGDFEVYRAAIQLERQPLTSVRFDPGPDILKWWYRGMFDWIQVDEWLYGICLTITSGTVDTWNLGRSVLVPIRINLMNGDVYRRPATVATHSNMAIHVILPPALELHYHKHTIDIRPSVYVCAGWNVFTRLFPVSS